MVLIILGQFYVKFGNFPVGWNSGKYQNENMWTGMPFT